MALTDSCETCATIAGVERAAGGVVVGMGDTRGNELIGL